MQTGSPPRVSTDELPTQIADSGASERDPIRTGEPMDAGSSDRGMDAAMQEPPPPDAPAVTPPTKPSMDAGAPDAAAPPQMTGDAGSMTVDAATMEPTVAPGCARDVLRERADHYLKAMNTGDTESLNLHSSARYTENGQTQTLGLGIWLSRPQPEFARHVLDEANCASVTEAVVNDLVRRIVFGVRLRYADQQLLEIEAQIVPRNYAYYEPDSIIPVGADRWIEIVPPAERSSREELVRMVDHYFDSVTDAGLLPPQAAECKRRQNGKLMDKDGSCAIVPGAQRFEARRYPVIDEAAGIVTAVVMYRDFLGMYLFKVQREEFQNIEVIGGASAPSTGW